MSRKFQAVLFDLDGTLIDTEPTAATAIRRSFEDRGIHLEPSDDHFVTGRTWESAFDYLLSKYKLPVSRQIAEKEVLRAYREALENELVVVSGGVEAVIRLAETLPLALVSGSHRSEILWALRKLGILDHFQAILGAEDYPRSKPAPDGYLAAICQLGVQSNCCLIFEDSQPGITSGRSAGAWVIAVTGTNHFKQDTSLAHGHIQDLTPVTTEWVNALGEKLLGHHPFARES